MIYGAEGENNVQRMAGLLRWLPVVPLPGGGRALVQPIYQDDVTRCIRAALAQSWSGPESIVIAGPTPLPYRDFVRAVAQASGAVRRPIVSLPGPVLMALARTASLIPGLPRVETAELRRLMEDKAFDIGPMRHKLGIDPSPLAEGLARTFAAKQVA
jgi:nucleoside-diphosphate-sugar epimerase